jgi:hypothetical protein
MIPVRSQTCLGAAKHAASHLGALGGRSTMRASSAILARRANVAISRAAPFYATTRQFSLTTDKIPRKDPPSLRTTHSMFPSPSYTDEELLGIEVGHRDTKTFADRLAFKIVRGARRSVDLLTGVTDKKPLTTGQYVR